MPVTPEFRDATLPKLAAVCNLRSKPMFGGIGIYCDEVFFACIDDDRIYFKVGAENLSDYEALGADSWVIGSGELMKNYRELPSAVLANPKELAVWIEKSVAAALNKKKR
ncbi:MAG: TfoX/Sxy family protein [Fimbriimonadaceae bacterium]